MFKMTAVLMGEESLLIQCAEVLLGRGHTISAIVSTAPPVRLWAETRKVPLIDPEGAFQDELQALSYDWFFSASNLRMVPAAVWQGARQGAANFHDGPLPRFAGLNAPSWALLAGEPDYAITWHAMTEGVDEGDIHVQIGFDIDEHDTGLTLNTKCFEAGIDGFTALVETIESGRLAPRPQDLSQRSYFPKFKRPDAAATLKFDRPTADLERLFRALDYGPGYTNPIALPKIRIGGQAYSVKALAAEGEAGHGEPGRVLSIDRDAAVIATLDGAVRVSDLQDEYGARADIATLLAPGRQIEPLAAELADELTALSTELARGDDLFRRKLGQMQDLDLSWLKRGAVGERPDRRKIGIAVPAGLGGSDIMAALVGFLSRAAAQEQFGVAYSNPELQQRATRLSGYLAPTMPFLATVAEGDTIAALKARVEQELKGLRGKAGQAGDLVARHPQLNPVRPAIGFIDGVPDADPVGFDGASLIFAFSGANAIDVMYNEAGIETGDIEALPSRLEAFLAAWAKGDDQLVSGLPVIGENERAIVLFKNNDTQGAYDRELCVHQFIERTVDRMPDAVALAFEDEEISYRELDDRANRVAAALIQKGVGPGSLVGLFLPRSIELVVGAFAIHKAGGAYVPLDPAYPADRTTLMAQDSGLTAIISRGDLLGVVPQCDAITLDIDAIGKGADAATRPNIDVASNELAYVIYTSGSTGRPKGVMVEHRNVANFFAGMDERVPMEKAGQPVWLAVTSLSFDISVLELFWTLARGFKVVINSEIKRSHDKPRRRAIAGVMDFSLFYWGNDDGTGRSKYDLLLNGARFADENGFKAVWTPERHFHAFGGPYPNPAVTGAAVAAVTRNIDIRAGSCVLPLHPPARVAEEWAVVDNLSNGRVGLAFASGWMPEDFVLRPENAPPDNKKALLRDIEVVRQLWRGEAVSFPLADGRQIPVVTQPRPVQRELPIWVTTAGNPDTYREAAKLGAHVLTHLLGQSIEELADKIRIYRDTLRETGRNPDDFTVTLMLHTLVGEDRERVKDLARKPMKDYLRSAAALIKQYAWAFPAFKKPQGAATALDIDLQSLSPDEMDAILEFAFLRYFEDSGLFGTVEDALDRVDQLKAIGVDEIACLIDYGVATNVVMSALTPLADVVRQANADAIANAGPERDFSFPDQIAHHGVTHLQATPSMMTMILMNEEDRQALARVDHLFIGGEPLQGSLMRQLREVTQASVENMYGPTETTIWSSTQTAGETDGVVPLGRPIANTQLYVLDREQSPVPIGSPGELYIAGDGVARGYLNRPDLTTERFLPNPFVPGGRMYRTGDLVRIDAAGALNFLGRADHQVKVRGYRIELGEIEARLGLHPGVKEAVVMAREDEPNDVRLVAYLRFVADEVQALELRQHLAEVLPDFMIPAHFVGMASFPLTPNAKVDRKALPRPGEARPAPVVHAPAVEIPLAGDLQQDIAAVFKQFLGLDRIGPQDNFFALGGHSLLAVQMHRHLKATMLPSLTITDLFRFPTVSALAEHMGGGSKASQHLERVADRAAMRRNALNKRSAFRS